MEQIRTRVSMPGFPKGWEEHDRFFTALYNFIRKEDFILINDLNERTLTHKLAEYLQTAFVDYDVDCEYNRMRSREIDQDYITKVLGLKVDNISSNDVQGFTVFPDIIIHKRGTDENNHIVVEVKKKKFANQKKDGITNREFDYKKLKAYKSQLQYKYAIYIEFDENNISRLDFVKSESEASQ